jgi:MerR family copper efflux transcriptional regulator
MGLELMRLTEVSERTGLSSTTIRRLETSRLVVPERVLGPHRLYSPADLTRLLLVKRMTALGLAPHEVRDLLDVLDELSAAVEGTAPGSPGQDDLVDRARAWLTVVRERRQSLRGQADDAEELATVLTLQLRRQGSAEPFSPEAMVPPTMTRTRMRA